MGEANIYEFPRDQHLVREIVTQGETTMEIPEYKNKFHLQAAALGNAEVLDQFVGVIRTEAGYANSIPTEFDLPRRLVTAAGMPRQWVDYDPAVLSLTDLPNIISW